MKKLNLSFWSLAVVTVALLFSSCKKDDDPAPVVADVAAKITSFKVTRANNTALNPVVTATIDDAKSTITAEVPTGTDVTKLHVEVGFATGAKIDLKVADQQDFSKPKTVIVTGKKDGKDETKTYTVTITVKAAEAKVTGGSFAKNGEVFTAPEGTTIRIDAAKADDTDSVVIVVPAGTTLTTYTAARLVATVSEGATYVVKKGATAVTAVASTNPAQYEIDLNKVQETDKKVTIEVTGSDTKTKKTYEVFVEYVPAPAAITNVTVTQVNGAAATTAQNKSAAPNASDVVAIELPNGTAINNLEIELEYANGVTVTEHTDLTPVPNSKKYTGDFTADKTIKVKGKDKNNGDTAVKTYTIKITAAS